MRDFRVVCEVEPATRADLMHVRHQIGVLSKVASAFLISDNHIGWAMVLDRLPCAVARLSGERGDSVELGAEPMGLGHS